MTDVYIVVAAIVGLFIIMGIANWVANKMVHH